MPRVVTGQMTGGQWTKYSLRLRNVAFFEYAKEFHHAGAKVRSPLVRAHLLGHALELFFKTYLLAKGTSIQVLKSKIGHNLARLLDECEKEGLAQLVTVSTELRADIDTFSKAYSSKALQYFSLLYLLAPPKLPDMNRLVRFINRLEKQLGKEINK